jgi:hypothetical protein
VNRQRKPKCLIALSVFIALWTARSAVSQCTNQTTVVPLHPVKAASRARDFVRFKYALTASDSLLIRSHEDTETSIGPYDTGFEIVRDGKALRNVALRNVRGFRREEPEYSESFTTLAIARACARESLIYFVTMQYMGDLTSPALTFVVVPSSDGYEITSLPMISGGVIDVSKADPRHIRTWDNLHEGNCEACETAYEITDYEIRGGKPIRVRTQRTKRLYQSGEFDDRRRIRFIP